MNPQIFNLLLERRDCQKQQLYLIITFLTTDIKLVIDADTLTKIIFYYLFHFIIALEWFSDLWLH
jgi:hypothetical protein